MSGASHSWYRQLKMHTSGPATTQPSFFCGYPQISKFLTGIPLQNVTALSNASVIQCVHLMFTKALGNFILLSAKDMELISHMKDLEARLLPRNLLWLFAVRHKNKLPHFLIICSFRRNAVLPLYANSIIKAKFILLHWFLFVAMFSFRTFALCCASVR